MIACHWTRVTKFNPVAAFLADGHYSRRTPGAPQYMPPGETICLLTPDQRAVFGWWRPHPDSGLQAMNGLDGWTCTIFRNISPVRSSDLILDAEIALYSLGLTCGPDGLITYVYDRKVATYGQVSRGKVPPRVGVFAKPAIGQPDEARTIKRRCCKNLGASKDSAPFAHWQF